MAAASSLTLQRTHCMEDCKNLYVGSHARRDDGPYAKLQECIENCANLYGDASDAPVLYIPPVAAENKTNSISCPGGQRLHSTRDLSGKKIDLINARIWGDPDDSTQSCEACAKHLEETRGLRPNWSCRNEKDTGRPGVWLSGCEFLQNCNLAPKPAGSPFPQTQSATSSDGRCMSDCKNVTDSSGICMANPALTLFNPAMATLCPQQSKDSCSGFCMWIAMGPKGCNGEDDKLISSWCAQFETEQHCNMSRDPSMKLQKEGPPYCKWYPNGDGPPPKNPQPNVDPCAQLKNGNC